MKRRILFVDDDRNILNGLKRLLKEHENNWEMSFLDCAKEINMHVNVFKPEVLVLDINMPYKNGIEILEEMKSNTETKNIEIIMMTGLEDKALKSRALLSGATDLLNKPIEKEDLIARIISTLRLKSYNDYIENQKNMLEQQLFRNEHAVVMRKFINRGTL